VINKNIDFRIESKFVANGFGLGEEADLEVQMFGLAQMFIRIPNVQFSTEPAFLPNACYSQCFLSFV
jgi:hypothetical protein